MHEFQIIQNPALGAMAIHAFAKAYAKQSSDGDGPLLPLIMPILPIVFNERATSVLWQVKRTTNSRFLTTLADYRDLPAGLQERMVDMADQTLKSLNLAFALNLVNYDQDNSKLIPTKYLKKIPKIHYRDNQMIIHGAKMLGTWFANYSIEELCISLNIYF